jgi:fatty acid desaturase
VWRDLSGQTGWKQRKELVVSAFRPAGGPISVRFKRAVYRLGPNLLINMAFLAGFVAYGVWYLYFLLWLLPSMTWLLFISRLRNIGEHACVVDNDDRLRNTRTTHASWLERMFIAPYWVNYHLEHHLLVSCPCYRLRRAHRILMAGDHGTAMDLQPSYAHVIRLATATA